MKQRSQLAGKWATAISLVLSGMLSGIGVCADTLKSEVELSTKEIGAKESVLGDLVADAIRAATKSDAALVAASCFEETSIPRGSLTTADILKTLVYKGDNLVVMKLTGSQILRGLEHGLYLYPKFNSAFLQVSGLVVTIVPDGEKEKRVASVKFGGDTLDANKSYRIAMPAPLANGALAYFKVWKKSDIEKDTGKTLEAAITEYLHDHPTITKGEERIVSKGK